MGRRKHQHSKSNPDSYRDCFRAQKYLFDILNTLQIDQKDILNHPDIDDIWKIGAVNRTLPKKKPKFAA